MSSYVVFSDADPLFHVNLLRFQYDEIKSTTDHWPNIIINKINIESSPITMKKFQNLQTITTALPVNMNQLLVKVFCFQKFIGNSSTMIFVFNFINFSSIFASPGSF